MLLLEHSTLSTLYCLIYCCAHIHERMKTCQLEVQAPYCYITRTACSVTSACTSNTKELRLSSRSESMFVMLSRMLLLPAPSRVVALLSKVILVTLCENTATALKPCSPSVCAKVYQEINQIQPSGQYLHDKKVVVVPQHWTTRLTGPGAQRNKSIGS